MNLLRPRLLGKVSNLLKNYIFCNEILSILQNYQCHLRIKSEPLFEETGLHYFLSDLSFPLVGNPSSARNDASRK